jgi:hypothetical protein
MKKNIILKEIYLLYETFSRDGESGNILDNLLKRMEQYANNLEVSISSFSFKRVNLIFIGSRGRTYK